MSSSRAHDPDTLAAWLAAEGFLGADWRDPFRRVRREDFVSDRIWVRGEDGYQPLLRAAEPERWREFVYSDVALVTQVEDESAEGAARVPSSSASMPRVVAMMLDVLRVDDGQRVLEIGTGTGYNAALLCERLGQDRVTTVEIDAELAVSARAALTATGHACTVVVGDGTGGCPEHAPYDRVLATCAAHEVPYAWVRQTAPGGLVVLPWGTDLHNGVLLRLTVQEGQDGWPTASGPVVGDSAFMWMRSQAPRQRDVMAVVRDRAGAVVSRTALDPRDALGDDDAAFAVGVLVSGCRSSVGHGPDGAWALWLADAASGAWASVDVEPGAGEFEVRQYGPRRLWAEVEDAYRWWRRSGSPGRARFGLAVTRSGQHVWLDRPERAVPG